MAEKDLTFIARRRLQSYGLVRVDSFKRSASAKLKSRQFSLLDPKTGKNLTTGQIKNLLCEVDTYNILQILMTIGVNKEPINHGFYLHPIEITKVLGLFQNDHLTNEHYDSGVVRIQRLMSSVGQLLLLQRLTLTNLPAAGYRIGSNEEACLEAKKSIVRSFGNIASALRRATHSVDMSKIEKEERERFEQVRKFCDRIFNLYKTELTEQDILARKKPSKKPDSYGEAFRHMDSPSP